jgi:hypothetical protein
VQAHAFLSRPRRPTPYQAPARHRGISTNPSVKLGQSQQGQRREDGVGCRHGQCGREINRHRAAFEIDEQPVVARLFIILAMSTVRAVLMPTPSDISPFSSHSRAAFRTFISSTRSTSRVSDAGNHRDPKAVNSACSACFFRMRTGPETREGEKPTVGYGSPKPGRCRPPGA